MAFRISFELPEKLSLDVHLYVHNSDTQTVLDAIREGFAGLSANLQTTETELTNMSKELDDLIVAVHSNSDTEDSAATALAGLTAQVTALANDPAALTSLMNEVTAKRDALAAAIANTNPQAPPPVIPPTA